jgi:hypothetical protein
VTDIPTEVVVAGFGGLSAAVVMLYRHFKSQNAQMRADMKDRIAALETALGKALDEIRELRHYERDRLFSIADQAHQRERTHAAWMRRLARCAHCPSDQTEVATEAIERTADPQPPRGSSSGFQPVPAVKNQERG